MANYVFYWLDTRDGEMRGPYDPKKLGNDNAMTKTAASQDDFWNSGHWKLLKIECLNDPKYLKGRSIVVDICKGS